MATEPNVMAVIRASRPSFRCPKKTKLLTLSMHPSSPAATSSSPPVLPPSPTMPSLFADEVGVYGWDQFEDNYSFLYLNPQKGSKKVLVKCLCLNDDKLMVDALSDGDSETMYLETNVGDYVAENGGSNYSSQFKN